MKSLSEIRAVIAAEGSIRKAAPVLGVDERTVRRWLKHYNAVEVPLRTLAIDIETAPALAHVWQLWDNHIPIDRVKLPGEVLCFAAKWLGEEEILFYRGEGMVEAAWRLLNQAEVIVTYNGAKFDVPWLNRSFVEAGMTPPTPYKHVDLYRVARSRFRFESNKLDYVAQQLGLGQKVKHSGFELWTRCMAGDEAAWEEMAEYNRMDVELLEPLYHRLLPWIGSLTPSVGAHRAADVCPNCGSEDISPSGVSVLKTGNYQQFTCDDCGTHMRSTSRSAATGLVAV